MLGYLLLIYVFLQGAPQSLAASTVPKVLNYQARITDASSVPVTNGILNISVKLYDAQLGGNCLYAMRGSCGTPNPEQVTVTNGVFSMLIGDGSDNEIPDGLFDANVVFLGVTVASDTEMTPRKRIVAAPYAINADRLDDMDAGDSGSTTPYVFAATTNGNLVITGNPQGAAVAQGSLYVNPAAASADETILGVADNGSGRFSIDREGDIAHLGSLLARSASSTAQFIFRGATSQSANIFEVQDIGTNKLFAVSATGVRIGSTSSTDSVVFTARVGSNFTPTTDATFDLGDYNRRWRDLWLSGGSANIAYDTSGTTILQVGFESAQGLRGRITTPTGTPLQLRSGLGATNDGIYINGANSVGIGTASPNGKLHVSTAASASVALRLTDAIAYTLDAGFAGSGLGYFGGPGGTALALHANGSEVMRLTNAGHVGIGNTAPASKLTVGSATGTFEVDNEGNIRKIFNVVYSWPSSQGGASTVLTNNGSGILTWASASSGSLQQAYNAATSSTELSISGQNPLSIADTLSGVGNIFEIQDLTNPDTGAFSRRYFTVSSTSANITYGPNNFTSDTLFGVAFNPRALTATTVSGTGTVISYGPQWSTAVTTPTLTGSAFGVSRNTSIAGSFASTLTVSGPVAAFTDAVTDTAAGTITHTADVVRIKQHNASNTGSGLNISGPGSSNGFLLRVNNDGTFADTTPPLFIRDTNSNVMFFTTTPSCLVAIGTAATAGSSCDLHVVSGGAGNNPLLIQGNASQSGSLMVFENSGGTNLLEVTAAGVISGKVSSTNLQLESQTTGHVFYSGGNGSSNGVVHDFRSGSGVTQTTGTIDFARNLMTFSGAGASTVARPMRIEPTVNYTGGSTGRYEALSIGVTETSLPSGTNYLIRALAGSAGTTDRFAVLNNGFTGINNASPANAFTVGSTSTLEVDVNGNLIKIRNVAYSWPSTQGAASSVLQNNGSGTLSWASAAGLVNLQQAYNNSTSSTTELSISGQNPLNIADTLSGVGNIFEIQDLTNPATGAYSVRYFTVSSTGVRIAGRLDGGTSQASPLDGRLTFSNTFDDTGNTTTNKITLYDVGGFRAGFGVSSNDLDYLSGGTHKFYVDHASEASEGFLALTLADVNGNASFFGDITGSKRINAADHANNQGLKLPVNTGAPSAVTGSVDGDIVWDNSGDALYVYNGATFQQIGGSSTSNLHQAYSTSSATGAEIYLDSSHGALTLADSFSSFGGNLFEIQDRSLATGEYSRRYFTVSSTNTTVNTTTTSMSTALTLSDPAGGNVFTIASNSGGTEISGSGENNFQMFVDRSLFFRMDANSDSVDTFNFSSGTAGTLMTLDESGILALGTASSTSALDLTNARVASNLTPTCDPSACAGFSLGDYNRRWKDLWLSGGSANIAYDTSGTTILQVGWSDVRGRRAKFLASGQAIQLAPSTDASGLFIDKHGRIGIGTDVLKVPGNNTGSAFLQIDAASGTQRSLAMTFPANQTVSVFEVIDAGTGLTDVSIDNDGEFRAYNNFSAKALPSDTNTIVSVGSGARSLAFRPRNLNSSAATIIPTSGMGTSENLLQFYNESAENVWTRFDRVGRLVFGATNTDPTAVLTVATSTLINSNDIFEVRNLTPEGGYTHKYLTVSGTGTKIAHTQLTAGPAGPGFEVTTSHSTGLVTSWSANKFNVTNSQASTASNDIAGIDLQFTQAATIAGNTEQMMRIALAESSNTDSTVANGLVIRNDDTATNGQVTLTDAIDIGGSNITNGINFSGTFATNYITSANFILRQDGRLESQGLDAKSAGTLDIGLSTATAIDFLGGSGSTGCSMDSSGNLTCSGTVTGSGGTNLQQAYNSSTSSAAFSAEISINSTHEAFTVADTLSGTGNVFEVQDRTTSAGSFSRRFFTVSSTNVNAYNVTFSSTSVQDTTGHSLLFAGTSGTTPMSGAGTRLMWIPSKKAFRAGASTTTVWDDVNIGSGSVAFGDGNTASGEDSAAFGLGTTASGGGSVAFGTGTVASNGNAFAGGEGTTVSGAYAFGFGENVTVSGVDGLGFGNAVTVNSTLGMAFGQYVTTGSVANAIAFGSGQGSGVPLLNSVASSFAVGFNSTAPTLTVRGKVNSGTGTLITVTGQAHAGLTASTEVLDVDFALNRTVHHATGAITTQRAALFQPPTYSFAGSSTITNAATLAISGAPAAGTNATITNSYALWAQAGSVRFDDDLFIGNASSTDEITLNAWFASNLTPDADNTYSLGEPLNRWKDLWLAGGSAHVAYDTSGTTSLDIGWKDTGGRRAQIFTSGQPIQISPSNAVNSGLNIDATGKVLFGTGTSGFDDSGRLGVGTSTLAYQFHVPGAAPTQVGSVTTASRVKDIEVKDNLLFAALSTGNAIAIYDVTDPAGIKMIGSATSADEPIDLDVQGQYLYVLARTGVTLQVYDISDPTSPYALSSVAAGTSNLEKIIVEGRYAYVLGAALRIFDVSDPRNPVNVGAITPSGVPSDLFIRDHIAYVVSDSSPKLETIDISDPGSPVSLDFIFLSPSSAPNAVWVKGRYAYVSAPHNTITPGYINIFDVSNPRDLVLAANIHVSSTSVVDSVMVGDRIYTASSATSKSIETVDVASSTLPTLGPTRSISFGVDNMTASDKYLYLAEFSTTATIYAYSLGGSYIQDLKAGSVDAYNLDVNNRFSALSGYVRDGLTVGQSIQTGFLSVSSATTTSLAENLVNLSVNQPAGGSYSGAMLNLKLNGNDADSFTGFGIRMQVQQSILSSGARPFLIEDSGGTDLFTIGETGTVTAAGLITASGGISLGTQTLSGSTAVIDFTNFDVTTGGAVTAAGLITANGGIDLASQTLSGTTAVINFSNFDVSSGGAITIAGDIAVNGGDVTTTAATASIYNTGATTINFGVSGSLTTVNMGQSTTTKSTSTFWDFDSGVDNNVQTFIIPQLITTNTCGSASPAGPERGLVFNNSGGTQVMGLCVAGPTSADANELEMFISGDLDIGHGNAADNDSIFFDVAAENLTWDNTGGNFDFSDALEIDSNGDQGERLCHSGADGATTALVLGDCAVAGADFAEWSLVTESGAEPGDIVYVVGPDSSDPTKTVKSLTTQRYQASVYGVISTNPFIDILGDRQYNSATNAWPIALAGRVPVKVSLENGPINVGDPLVASSIPGVAMKADRKGVIIGRAEEAYDGSVRVSPYVLQQEELWITHRNGRGHEYHSNPALWPADVGKITTSMDTGYYDPDIVDYRAAIATLLEPGKDSHSLNFFGSAWDSASSTAVTRSFTMLNRVTDPANYVLAFQDQSGNDLMKLDQDGDLEIAGTLTSGGGFDYAELFPAVPDLEAGDVVMVDAQNENGYGVKKSDKPYENSVIGIISSKPGFLTGRKSEDGSEQPVALAGRVPVKVNLEGGAVSPGDPLTSSSTPGVAMKATAAGRVIGIALEGYADQGTGLITVFVNPSWWNGPMPVGPASAGSGLSVTQDSLIDMKNSTFANVAGMVSSNGLWSITSDGYLVAQDVEAKRVTAQQVSIRALADAPERTVGVGRIEPGYTATLILNPAVKANSLIVVTFEGNPGSSWWISDKQDGQFSVSLAAPPPGPLKFTYWLIGVEGVLDPNETGSASDTPETGPPAPPPDDGTGSASGTPETDGDGSASGTPETGDEGT